METIPKTEPNKKNTASLVRVFWINLEDGSCGNGQPVTLTEAEAVLAEVVPQYPHIQHWITDED